MWRSNSESSIVQKNNRVREKIRGKRAEKWQIINRFLHHDNGSVRAAALSVSEFLKKKKNCRSHLKPYSATSCVTFSSRFRDSRVCTRTFREVDNIKDEELIMGLFLCTFRN